MNMLSRIIRSSALLMVFGFSASSAFLFLYQHQNLEESYREIDFSANILAHETSQKKESQQEKLVNNIRNHSLSGAQILLKDIPGAEDFLEDFVSWGTILSVTTDETESGFFLNVTTTIGESDLLHPFSGFVQAEKGKIQKIVWGKSAMGTLSGFQQFQEKGFWQATIRNDGPYPWLLTDDWKNSADNKEMLLIPPTGKTELDPGETGLFLFQESESFFPENKSRAFLFLLRTEEEDASGEEERVL